MSENIDTSKVSKKWKIGGLIFIVVLFILVCWWHNKDNDITDDLVDDIKKEQVN